MAHHPKSLPAPSPPDGTNKRSPLDVLAPRPPPRAKRRTAINRDNATTGLPPRDQDNEVPGLWHRHKPFS